MRLIDADKMTKVLKEMQEHSYDGKVYIENCLYLISIQDTAYDVDKVVAELGTAREDYVDDENYDVAYGLKLAMEIVKGV